MAHHACNSIVADYTKQVYVEKNSTMEIPLDLEIDDTYPDTPYLRSSAEAGCEFCALLRQTVISKIRNSGKPFASGSARPTPFFITEASLCFGGDDQNNLYALRMYLVMEEENRVECLEFSLHADQDDGVARSVFPRRRLSDDPCSPASLALVKAWIDECKSKHPGDCSLPDPAKLPTRVIDVGTKLEASTCALVETKPGASGDYAALSYVWGTDVAFTTTTSTLAERKQGIHLSSMTQTLRDAVKITRLLGIRYLWIDALCIIQDSKEDWAKEASMMGKVYKNSCITVAATCASGASEGFLQRPASLEAQLALPVLKSGSPTQQCHVYLRASQTEGTYAEDLLVPEIESTTWNSRAWIMQERNISTRVIHFAKNRLYFQCRSGQQSEDNFHFTNNPVFASVQIPPDLHVRLSDPPPVCVPLVEIGEYLASQRKPVGDQADGFYPQSPGKWRTVGETVEFQAAKLTSYDIWYDIVSRYSKRKLTYASDKLPAMLAVAEDAAGILNDSYLAGLWENDLAVGLLWIAPEHDTKPEVSYMAPSWSWASHNGPIEWPSDLTSVSFIRPLHCELPLKPEFELISVNIDTSGPTPFGAVANGSLVLRGKLLSITLTGRCTRRLPCRFLSSFVSLAPPAAGITDFGMPEVAVDLESRSTYELMCGASKIAVGYLNCREVPREGTQFVCFQVFQQRRSVLGGRIRPRWTGLVLEVVEGREDTYRRAGVFILLDSQLDRFAGVRRKVVTLI